MPGLTAAHVPALPPQAPAWQRVAHAAAYSAWFSSVIIAVIVLNAVSIGLNTFDSLHSSLAPLLAAADHAFLSIFLVELAIRFVAHDCSPKDFFSHGWNVFDTLVIALAFVPGVSNSVTALRIVRLLRVARLLRMMPDVKVLFDGMRRAGRPALSLLAMTALMCYMYAVVGNLLFEKSAPGYFGNIGEGMLTLFQLLTLEGWNDILHDLRAASPVGLAYTVVFVLFGTYIVVNLVVGVVITSLEDAYEHRRHGEARPDVARCVHDLQAAVDQLKATLPELERPTDVRDINSADTIRAARRETDPDERFDA